MTERILADFVSVNSIFPNEGKFADLVAKRLKNEGFRVQKQIFDGRINIFAERGKGRNSFLFYGHLDTVPVYGKWNTDPLRLTKRGKKLYGLGASDMKGGIAAMIEAVRASKQRKVKILLCSDEENISRGIWEAVTRKRSWFNDVNFILSGEQGTSRKHVGGVDVLTLGRRGRIVLKIDVTGESFHGSMPGKGVNAIEEASKIALELSKLKLRKHKYLPAESLFVRKLVGESTSLSIPENAYLEVDIHFVPPSTPKELQKKVNKLVTRMKRSGRLNRKTVAKVALKRRETPYLQPYFVYPNNPKIKRLVRLVEKNFRKPSLNYGTSVADENAIASILKAPIVTIGPQGGNCHSKNEFVYEASMRELVRLYALMLDEI